MPILTLGKGLPFPCKTGFWGVGALREVNATAPTPPRVVIRGEYKRKPYYARAKTIFCKCRMQLCSNLFLEAYPLMGLSCRSRSPQLVVGMR